MSYETSKISETLKARRVNRGLSQRDLSELSGVPQAQISKLENGQADVRMSTLVAIARALELELEFVPRKNLPAVQSIVRKELSSPNTQRSERRAEQPLGTTNSRQEMMRNVVSHISSYSVPQNKSAYSLTDEDDE